MVFFGVNDRTEFIGFDAWRINVPNAGIENTAAPDVMPSEWPLVRRKSGVAGIAAEPLNASLTVTAEALAVSWLRRMQVIGPLAFLQEKPDNQVLTSESGLRSLVDLAPPSVSADGGVF